MKRSKVQFDVTAPWPGWFVRDMQNGPSIHFFEEGQSFAMCRDGEDKPLAKLTMNHEAIAVKKVEIPDGACDKCAARLREILGIGRGP